MYSSNPNPYVNAQNLMGNAASMTGAAGNYAVGMPTATAGARGYDAFTGLDATGNPLAGYGTANATGHAAKGYGATGYAAQGFGAQGYDATGYGATGYGYAGDVQDMQRARDIQARMFRDTNIDPYMNPYTDEVINRVQSDAERARLMQQNAANDAAQAAGAFGGTAHFLTG